MVEERQGPGWRQVAVVLGIAVLLVVSADLAFRRICPTRYVREVADAMAEYEGEDPTVLVLGSSHARTFATMDGIVRERTKGRERIMAVPVEWGKFRSYEWVLQHRVEPLVDERGSDGTRKRKSLRRFVLQTAWWDACWLDGDPPVFNLPSRAWTFEDFVRDVGSNGITDHNRNYVTSRWGELWHGSILVSDRGQNHLITEIRERVKPLSAEAKQAQYEMRLENWRGIMIRGKKCIGHRDELAAADRIVSWAVARGYDVTVMLYPMMPITVIEDTRLHVQIPFEDMMRDLANRHGVRFVDATFDNGGMSDTDFQPDFDHLTPAGHVKLSEWLLSERMGFLLEGAPHTTRAPRATQGADN